MKKNMGSSREKREGMRTGSFPPPLSSSSDFEFTFSLSPSSRRWSNHLCPADELFYKGQLLPLHLSPRISMVRTLLLASSSSSASSSSTDTTTTASRDSNASSSSSSASSVMEEEARRAMISSSSSSAAKRGRYFSSLANRFSSVFLNRKKDATAPAATELDYRQVPAPLPAGKRANATAKQVIKKCVKKVKPLYEKLSLQKNQNLNQNQKKKTFSFLIRRERDATLTSSCNIAEPHSFSGNLRYPRRKRCAGSCPSSMRSSPTHSGLLRINGGGPGGFLVDPPSPVSSSSSSSMDELQSAIQGAIAHCKSTISQSNPKKDSSAAATCSNHQDCRNFGTPKHSKDCQIFYSPDYVHDCRKW